jgi:hypothetical protein
MATGTQYINPRVHTRRYEGKRPAFVVAALGLAVALALGAAPAAAVGQLGSVDLVSRPDGRTLAVYAKDGRNWVVGTPGQEYGIRVCNTTGGRMLAVMSVDGVNIVSGDTASPAQSGYVLAAYECADINGWRKSQSATAAFYFTTLADSYATRTGRPDNLGVIGVAFFRERAERVAWKDTPAKIAASPAAESVARQDAAAGGAKAEGRMERERAQSANDSLAASRPEPAPMAKIGTGYGRHESSYVQMTRFERESATPNETVAINYDRRENLIAMGILPPPSVARSPNPFPAWPRFVPEPPQR